MGSEISADDIGRAARKAASVPEDIPNYFLTDKVAIMVLLDEIVVQLRIITKILENKK